MSQGNQSGAQRASGEQGSGQLDPTLVNDEMLPSTQPQGEIQGEAASGSTSQTVPLGSEPKSASAPAEAVTEPVRLDTARLELTQPGAAHTVKSSPGQPADSNGTSPQDRDVNAPVAAPIMDAPIDRDRPSQPSDRSSSNPSPTDSEPQDRINVASLSWQDIWRRPHRLPQTVRTLIKQRKRSLSPVVGHCLMGLFAVSGAIATAVNPESLQTLERQAQALFFRLSVRPQPSEEVMILAIDSLDPSLYGPDAFNLVESWPWKRETYAIVAERLLEAGAHAVAIDIIFDGKSRYRAEGEPEVLPEDQLPEDDLKLQQVLEQYGSQIVLAIGYDIYDTQNEIAEIQGDTLVEGFGYRVELLEPLFDKDLSARGLVKYHIEPNGKIHQLSREFAQEYLERDPILHQQLDGLVSFDQATLDAAQVEVPEVKGENIFFYGPQGTFPSVPFWEVLDTERWQYHQQEQTFKDKIILVGSTSSGVEIQDSHPTPFRSMPGIEIHANAVSTLMQGRAISTLLPNPYIRGLVIAIIAVGTGLFISRATRTSGRIVRTAGVVVAGLGIGYITFVGGRQILPTAALTGTMTLCGIAYITTGVMKEKRNLRRTLKHYSASPLVQEIISEQDNLKDLLREREKEILGQRLGSRYKVVQVLGAGGFGATYIAEDTQRPGNPKCVVKQLRPATNDPALIALAKRLFEREANTLESLGTHTQIPQLFAYFAEQDEFYLVEEYIPGTDLNDELPSGYQLSEVAVVNILRELLQILDFIHSRGVIHRDIKPNNIIRRSSDYKLVLIDFGAVKEINTQIAESQSQTAYTVGIGTQGYMANEQCAGNPRFNSDIYSVGIIGIQALSGIHPERLEQDPRTGEILWQYRVKHASDALVKILTKMVRYNFSQRYQSAAEVLDDLNGQALSAAILSPKTLPNHLQDSPVDSQVAPNTSPQSDQEEEPELEESTMLWPEPAHEGPSRDDLTASKEESPTMPWPVNQEGDQEIDDEQAETVIFQPNLPQTQTSALEETAVFKPTAAAPDTALILNESSEEVTDETMLLKGASSDPPVTEQTDRSHHDMVEDETTVQDQ